MFSESKAKYYIPTNEVKVRKQGSTHSAVDVCLSPHCVMLPVNNFGTTQDMEILHHILLNISQRRNLSEVACREREQVNSQSSQTVYFVNYDWVTEN